MNESLFTTPSLTCRLVGHAETPVIEAASAMDIEVWGGLGQDARHFEQRAANGFLIGAFVGDELEGTISCVRLPWDPVYAIGKTPGHPYSTWNGITSGGTFARSDPLGDALFCVAVTSRGSGARPFPPVPAGDHPALALACLLVGGRENSDVAHRLTAATADLYMPLDYVVRFHARPKAGGLGGARIVVPLPGGRPADLESMGCNVILAYPDVLPGSPPPADVPAEVTTGEALVLAAARLAWERGIRVVSPYSRPAGFRNALVRALTAVASGRSGERDPFLAAVARAVHVA